MSVFGTIGVRDFDFGVVKTLGGELVFYEVDGDVRQVYVVSIDGFDSRLDDLGGKIPVTVSNPEDVFSPFVIPCFLIRRNDLTPAFDRQSWFGNVGRVPADGAKEVTAPDGQRGYDSYATQRRAVPFDITYDLTMYARIRNDAQVMLDYVLRRFKPPWFNFYVEDSLGDQRIYDAGEISISDSSELVDIAERTIAYMVSFTVRGEMDLDDISVSQAVTGGVVVGVSGDKFVNDGRDAAVRRKVTGFAKKGALDVIYHHYSPRLPPSGQRP